MSQKWVPLVMQMKDRGAAFMSIFSAGYKTNIGHGASLQRPGRRNPDRRAEMIQMSDVMEDTFNMNDAEVVEDANRFQRQMANRTKLKIIEKKYFKKPQEQNLLTWDAKEQMRYLHQEYPNEWTIDRLADSFPISRDGVIRILKSSWKPESLSQVLRHDRKVQKNWLALKSSSETSGGPIELRYQKLIESGKLALATGADLLPSPTTSQHFLNAPMPNPVEDIKRVLDQDYALTRRHNKNLVSIGPFESMVKKYCQQRLAESTVDREKHKKQVEIEYAQHQDNTHNLLQDVMKEIVPQLKGGSDTSLRKAQRDLLVANNDKYELENENEVTVDRTLFDSMQTLSKTEADAILTGQDEITEGEVMSSEGHYINAHESLHTHREKSQAPVKKSNYHIEDRMNHDIPDEHAIEKKTTKFSYDDEKTKVIRRVRFDVPSHQNVSISQEEEAYIYTEEDGYQYPLGRVDPEARIKVPRQENKDGKSRLYQKGKSVYDENGELLYRIP